MRGKDPEAARKGDQPLARAGKHSHALAVYTDVCIAYMYICDKQGLAWDPGEVDLDTNPVKSRYPDGWIYYKR